MKILVSGFEPFLGEEINPSGKLALELADFYRDVECLILPVEFENSFKLLKSKILVFDPDYVVMIGQAAGRKNICLEKVGLNWIQTDYADESQILPKTGKIFPNVELALMTSFPVDRLLLDLKIASLPIEASFSAGTFVCNDLYFRVLNEFRNLKSVFVHVPLLPEQLKVGDSRPVLDFNLQLGVLKFLVRALK